MWYPLLLGMSVEDPLLLPLVPDLLVEPQEHPHPMILSGRLRLVVWTVSCNSTRTKEYRDRLQSSFSLPGENQQRSLTPHHGQPGIAGVLNKVSIPFQLL